MFITFEGIEGCGKTTQVRRLADNLMGMEITVVLTLEPGGTRVGQDIRRMLLDSRNSNLTPLAELLLYEADRAQHVEEVVKPALTEGKWVLCDRFFDSTMVYQGYARGQDMTLIGDLNEKCCSGILPDLTFVVDCPVQIGIKRALKRNEVHMEEGQDRFEREKRDFHEAVRNGYLKMAMEAPKRIVVVDGTLNEDELEKVIFNYVRPFLAGGVEA